MKTQSFFYKVALFIFVMAFLVLPPIFSTSPASFSWSFPYTGFFMAIINIMIYVYIKRDEGPLYIKDTKLSLMIKAGYALLAFGTILNTGLLFQIISYLKHLNPESSIIRPKGLQWINFILIFAFGSLNEEIIYRFYLCHVFLQIAKKIQERLGCKWNVSLFLIANLPPLLLFSLGHRYLGLLPVINALIAHIVFRFCYVKSKSLVAMSISHMVYNILMMLFSLYLA